MGIFSTIRDAIFGAPAEAAEKGAAGGGAAAESGFDVAANLEERLKAQKQKLNWRTSIVDLMKLLELDSSYSARKELADELGFTGDKGDSATMNVWLHKQVMNKLAENGGVVPDDLKD